MAKTFSVRRLEVVRDDPAVAKVKERWLALFCEDAVSTGRYCIKMLISQMETNHLFEEYIH